MKKFVKASMAILGIVTVIVALKIIIDPKERAAFIAGYKEGYPIGVELGEKIREKFIA